MRVTVDIFEEDESEPVLSHTMYGQTIHEARDLVGTHAKYDKFLAAAMSREVVPGRWYEGTFQGMKLRAVIREE